MIPFKTVPSCFYPPPLLSLSLSLLSQVRAASVFALGTYLLNTSEDGTSEMRITIDQMIGTALLRLINDGSSIVRKVHVYTHTHTHTLTHTHAHAHTHTHTSRNLTSGAGVFSPRHHSTLRETVPHCSPQCLRRQTDSCRQSHH